MTRPGARWLAGGAVALLLLLALIPIARWEDRRHVNRELAGIRRVLAAIGPYDQPRLDAYRKSVAFPPLDCLLYRRGSNPYALEFCFDTQGRVVEGYDRRGTSPRIWSIREEPSKSTIRVDRTRLDELIERLQQPVS
jgi:hypothetical protein